MRYEFEVETKLVWHRPLEELKPKKPKAPPIRRTLVLAYQISNYMAAHKITTLGAFCEHANVTPARITQILGLLHLSIRIQEQILMDESPKLYKMTEWAVRPLLKELYWPHQEELWRAILQRDIKIDLRRKN